MKEKQNRLGLVKTTQFLFFFSLSPRRLSVLPSLPSRVRLCCQLRRPIKMSSVPFAGESLGILSRTPLRFRKDIRCLRGPLLPVRGEGCRFFNKMALGWCQVPSNNAEECHHPSAINSQDSSGTSP
ncbi:hypothetical protein CDAR_598331 [Caerostris darwini]|uniref:Uncharacterized protein n=1 Tax=Caerostris darwini TaxID=1538125 RepID=A0AAV4QMX5_9ARAC|nr:hypothetical protein CDAR_598331 [Caerostris darwini]